MMKRGGKATHEQLRRHNLHLLLRAVFSGEADSRAALAAHTGLAKPTVSELVGDLIRSGLLAEGGHGRSTESGGKPPRLLQFVPEVRQVIGVAVDADRVSALLANLDGQTLARHEAAIGDQRGDSVLTLLREVINGLVAQLDAPLLCLGVGVPGLVAPSAGVVRDSQFLGWRDLALATLLTAEYGVPAYIANSTELAAMAHYTFAADDSVDSLVILLINHSIEVGIALGGAYHSGSDIGCLQIAFDDGGVPLQQALSLPATRLRADVMRARFPAGRLDPNAMTYLDLRAARLEGDPIASALYAELADRLAEIAAWVVALLHPDHIALAGSIADLGEPLLTAVAELVPRRLHAGAAHEVRFSLADSPALAALGAVANALQHELGILA